MKVKNLFLGIIIGLSTLSLSATAQEIQSQQKTEIQGLELSEKKEDTLIKLKDLKSQQEFDNELKRLEALLKKSPTVENKIELFSLFIAGGMKDYFKESDTRWSKKNIEDLFLNDAKKDNGKAQMALATFYLMNNDLTDSFKWAWVANENPNGAYPQQANNVLKWILLIKSQEGEDILPLVEESDKLYIDLRPNLKEEYLKKVKENREEMASQK